MILPPIDDALSTDPLHRLVRTPPRSRVPPALLFVLSFVLFMFLTDRGVPRWYLAILAAVLLFHEAGHALGMLALGYRDVRIFFIPFFGAATSGRRDGGAGARHGVVLLLGPVPGILLGAAIVLGMSPPRETLAGYAARMLVYVNAFNLLPIMPLDGGRLFGLLLFNRHRALELLSRILSAAGFAALAVRTGITFCWVLTCFPLIGARSGWAVATAADELRRGYPPPPDRLEEASEDLIRDADFWLPERYGTSLSTRALWLRQVIERAMDAEGAPRIASSIALFMAWVMIVGTSFVAIGMLGKMR